uniref:Uncharacterized protein n=1 Tax=Arundo donax TaxID=35708 RepID=A0A0A9E3P4_ARUDO
MTSLTSCAYGDIDAAPSEKSYGWSPCSKSFHFFMMSNPNFGSCRGCHPWKTRIRSGCANRQAIHAMLHILNSSSNRTFKPWNV